GVELYQCAAVRIRAIEIEIAVATNYDGAGGAGVDTEAATGTEDAIASALQFLHACQAIEDGEGTSSAAATLDRIDLIVRVVVHKPVRRLRHQVALDQVTGADWILHIHGAVDEHAQITKVLTARVQRSHEGIGESAAGCIDRECHRAIGGHGELAQVEAAGRDSDQLADEIFHAEELDRVATLDCRDRRHRVIEEPCVED